MATIEFVGLISPRRSGTQLNWPWASWPKRRPEWYFQVAGWGQGRLRATRPIFRNGDKHGRRGASMGNRRYGFGATAAGWRRVQDGDPAAGTLAEWLDLPLP